MFCNVRFWTCCHKASRQRGAFEVVCVWGKMGQLQAFLHASVFQYRSWSDGRLQPFTVFGSANDMLQSGIVLGRGGSISESDGKGQDWFSDGSVKALHCMWQVEYLQPLQGIYPLLSFLDEGADVELLIEIRVRLKCHYKGIQNWRVSNE